MIWCGVFVCRGIISLRIVWVVCMWNEMIYNC
jgi:hypothetical protein